MIWDIVDVNDTWDSAIEDINEAVKNSAIKNGLIKSTLDRFKFKVPNIQDMLVYHNGTICKACRKNMWCEKHRLMKKEKLIDFDEDDFDRM